MARAMLVVGLALVLAGCGGGAQERAHRPTKASHPRVLTASDVDVLSPSAGAGFPGGTVGCELQVRRMLLRQARHGRTAADREGARVMLRALADDSQPGAFQSGCSQITIPLTRRAGRR